MGVADVDLLDPPPLDLLDQAVSHDPVFDLRRDVRADRPGG
jgi:hypothetical protein